MKRVVSMVLYNTLSRATAKTSMHYAKKGNLVFKLFRMLINMTEPNREEIMQYQKDLFDAFELNGKDNGIDI